jgi:DNA-binding transcriptional LysR family regulator
MELRDIEYFAVIAEHGNLGRAAEALGLSPTALSKSLRRLEASVQAKLVRRTPKGVELTAEGGLLLARARELRITVSDISREIADLSRGRAGSLRLGVHPGMIEDLVTPACNALLTEDAKVTLHVAIGSIERLLPTLQRGDLDLVIADLPAAPYADLVHEHLFDDDLVVFASKLHPLAKKKRVRIADLETEQWTSISMKQLGSRLPQLFADHGLRDPRIALYTTSLRLRDGVVAATLALGTSSRRVLREIAQRLEVQEIPVEGLRWSRKVGISYRKNAYHSPLARRMIDLVRQAAEQFRGR